MLPHHQKDSGCSELFGFTDFGCDSICEPDLSVQSMAACFIEYFNDSNPLHEKT